MVIYVCTYIQLLIFRILLFCKLDSMKEMTWQFKLSTVVYMHVILLCNPVKYIKSSSKVGRGGKQRLLLQMMLLKYSLLQRILPPLSSHGQTDSEILFVFRKADPSLLDKHSAPLSRCHFSFLFSKSSHHWLPILVLKGHKSGTKIPAKDLTKTVFKIRPWIKFKLHLVQRKVKFFKTIKSDLVDWKYDQINSNQ